MSASIDTAADPSAPANENGKQLSQRKRRAKANAQRNSSQELSSKESLGGALARATIGSLAFFFRLPIRLFRPVKLSSWTVLESFAKSERKSLTLTYFWRLLRRENRTFIVHLLGPPFLYNTLIGFSLFESYSLTEARLLRKHRPDLLQQPKEWQSNDAAVRKAIWTPLWMVAIAGSAAGTAQCILSAPLDNVRLVLMSYQNSIQRKRRNVSSTEARRSTTISWRAVFRAALLPFAPEQTHKGLMRAVRSYGKYQGARDAVKVRQTGQSFFAPEQWRLWQQRLKRLSGSVHGAGLIMSLARDSVGFASFFLIFEVFRRVAYSASTGIDRSIAWWSATGELQMRQYQGSAQGDGGQSQLDERFHTQAIRADLSYTASRTKTGRVIAAFVLILGGAIGAFAYEAVGRPFELMRLIIWQGRRQWQRARAKQRQRAKGGRSARSFHVSGRGGQVVSATANSSACRLDNLLTLRPNNSTGTRLPRMQLLFSQSHPPHPLRKPGRQLGVSPEAEDTAAQPRRASSDAVVSRCRYQSKIEAHVALKVSRHPPRALGLLLQHAERTSKLAYTSYERKFRTAVPAPVLLAHTYFIAPYLLSPGAELPRDGDSGRLEAQAKGGKAAISSSASKSSKSITTQSAARLLSKWINKNPVLTSITLPSSAKVGRESSCSVGSSAGDLSLSYLPNRPASAPALLQTTSAARARGSSRTAWALRRLVTPYSLGMLCFAWLTGDV